MSQNIKINYNKNYKRFLFDPLCAQQQKKNHLSHRAVKTDKLFGKNKHYNKNVDILTKKQLYFILHTFFRTTRYANIIILYQVINA